MITQKWPPTVEEKFNVFRVFNAHRATYAERIALLEALKHIDQDWQAALDKVIDAFKKDWAQRIRASAGIITVMLADCLASTLTRTLTDETNEQQAAAALQQSYQRHIALIETSAQQRIRGLFKHNIFQYDLPPHSIVHADLFSESTWNFLGLSRKQQIVAAGLGGAGLAAAIDAATVGTSFGLFSAVGGLAGAAWAAWGGRVLAETKILGVPLGGREMRVGPVKNIQLLYILLDRSLIYFSHIINWAHGRRDDRGAATPRDDIGYTAGWDAASRRTCAAFFEEVTGTAVREPGAKEELARLLITQLQDISLSEPVE